jgi:hypothetical protein
MLDGIKNWRREPIFTFSYFFPKWNDAKILIRFAFSICAGANNVFQEMYVFLVVNFPKVNDKKYSFRWFKPKWLRMFVVVIEWKSDMPFFALNGSRVPHLHVILNFYKIVGYVK